MGLGDNEIHSELMSSPRMAQPACNGMAGTVGASDPSDGEGVLDPDKQTQKPPYPNLDDRTISTLDVVNNASLISGVGTQLSNRWSTNA